VFALDTTALTIPGRHTVSVVADGTNYLLEPGCSVQLTRECIKRQPWRINVSTPALHSPPIDSSARRASPSSTHPPVPWNRAHLSWVPPSMGRS
jgi:hypothetical protein